MRQICQKNIIDTQRFRKLKLNPNGPALLEKSRNSRNSIPLNLTIGCYVTIVYKELWRPETDHKVWKILTRPYVSPKVLTQGCARQSNHR